MRCTPPSSAASGPIGARNSEPYNHFKSYRTAPPWGAAASPCIHRGSSRVSCESMNARLSSPSGSRRGAGEIRNSGPGDSSGGVLFGHAGSALRSAGICCAPQKGLRGSKVEGGESRPLVLRLPPTAALVTARQAPSLTLGSELFEALLAGALQCAAINDDRFRLDGRCDLNRKASTVLAAHAPIRVPLCFACRRHAHG